MDYKFFDPETGAELHRMPDGATIPARTAYGFIRRDGSRGWKDGGVGYKFNQLHDYTYFTREPIAPPKPPLPTEPGSLIRAVNIGGDECATMIRSKAGDWVGVDQDGHYRFWSVESITSGEPMTAAPTETWDRLRVLDPEDTRDRVDANGARWINTSGGWLLDTPSALRCFMSLENIPGPLRFADEVSEA